MLRLPSPCGNPDFGIACPARASVKAITRSHPASLRAEAQADRVAPVVCTSSTRSTRVGTGPTARTRGGSASLARRCLPTWRGPWARRRQATYGRQPSVARARAISSAGSNPRQRHRHGAAGTGTTVPPSSSAGQAARITSAATRARTSRRPNLRPWASSRATPSNREAATASVTPLGPLSISGLARASAARQRPQRTTFCSQGSPQQPQRGGATAAASCRTRVVITAATSRSRPHGCRAN